MYALKRDAHHRITSSDVAYPTVFAAAHALLGFHPTVLAVFVDADAGALGVVLGASSSASDSASGNVVCKLRRTSTCSDGIVTDITRTSQVLAAQPLPFLHADAILTLRDFDAALRRASQPPKRAAFESAVQAIREEQANMAEHSSDSDSDSEYVPPYSDCESESDSDSNSDSDTSGVDDNDLTFLP